MEFEKWKTFFRIFSAAFALGCVGLAFSIAIGLVAPLSTAALSVIVLLLCAVAMFNAEQEM